MKLYETFQTLRNIHKPFKTFQQNLSKPFKTFQNLSKPFKTFQNLSSPKSFLFKTFPLTRPSLTRTALNQSRAADPHLDEAVEARGGHGGAIWRQRHRGHAPVWGLGILLRAE